MSYNENKSNYSSYNDSDYSHRSGGRRGGRYRDEVYSKRVPAGKRTYFFDVKTTRSGDDYFITITESKRVEEGSYEKHKVFLYKEDFGKFVAAIHEVMGYIQAECLPGYEFRDMPDLTEYAPIHADAYEDD